MKIFGVRVGLFVVFVTVCASAGGYFYYQAQEEAKAQEAARQAHAKAQAEQLAKIEQARKIEENSRLFADRAMNEAVPKSYPRPISEWKFIEKSIFQKLLSSRQFDVLVVPFQVKEYALDRPTRSFMTAELAFAVSSNQKLHVPDPYLVARALGEGERRIDPNEAYALADKIGAKKIVWGYVGHNRNNQMSLTVQFQVRGIDGVLNAQTPISSKIFENIPFSDTQPPIETYQQMLPEILMAISVDSPWLTNTRPVSQFNDAGLPLSPLAVMEEKPELARDALYFQLLAYLVPDEVDRTRERFAEKSLLAIYSMSPDSRDYKVLKARALMLLGLRPAALQALGEPKTVEEKELHAVLNGNQPEVDLYSSKFKPGMNKLIAKLDANYLSSVYGGADKAKSIAAAASLKLPGKIWPFLSVRAFADLDAWAQFENIYFKQFLDHEFPVKDYTAEGIVRGASALGNTDKLQTLADLSVINHIRKLLDIDAAKWCSETAMARPAAWDYLTLIEAIGEDDLFRRASFLTKTQGVPERTLVFLNEIESVYKGHPQFSLARAKAQFSRANEVDGAEKAGLLKSAYTNAFDTYYWEQGQTVLAAVAFDFIPETGRQDYGYFDSFYASDYPFRAYYSDWEHGGNVEISIANAEAALKNSTSSIRALYSLNWSFEVAIKNEEKRDALFKSIEGRFAGSPDVYQLLAKNSLKKGDVRSAEKYFSESIKAQPMTWQGYVDLGTTLIDQGQLERASKLFISYPGFERGSKMNPVGIANAAYDAGSKFYWMGEFSLAKPFYKIASTQETNSSTELSSSLRLKLLNGDYKGAMLGSLERARHYNSSYAYRDYLGLLHAMGESKMAWEAFNVLTSQIDDFPIWESLLVAHRKEGRTNAEVAAWAKLQVTQNVVKRNTNRVAKYLLLAGVTDRVPTEEMEGVLVEIAQPVWKVEYNNGMIVQPSDDGHSQIILGPQAAEKSVLPNGVYEGAKKKLVKSNLVYFAEAYRAIRKAEYSSASVLLQEASTLYDLSRGDLGYLLPYYAFSAAKSGNVAAVENYLAGFSTEKKGFDYLLAKAVIAGVDGKTEESIQFLKSAKYKRPFTEERPLQTEYQFANLCELLYESTKNPKYREIALDWAKKNQRFQPWFAWSYAMEAVYTSNSADKKRAIAIASFLDPQSAMLGRIPKKERADAERDFVGMNPFDIKKNSSGTQAPI